PDCLADCRTAAGTRLGERARVEYVSPALFSTWAGCHPLLVSGEAPQTQWAIRIEPKVGEPAFKEIDRTLPPDASLAAVCPWQVPPDRPCAWAVAHLACSAAGPGIVRCEANGAARAAWRDALR